MESSATNTRHSLVNNNYNIQTAKCGLTTKMQKHLWFDHSNGKKENFDSVLKYKNKQTNKQASKTQNKQTKTKQTNKQKNPCVINDKQCTVK